MNAKLSFIPFFKENDKKTAQFKSVNKFGGVQSIQQINCFIGSNNSGKSRLIRNLYAALDYKSVDNVINFEFFNITYHGEEWNNLYIIHYLRKKELLNDFHEAIEYLLDVSNYRLENTNHKLYYYVNQLQGYKKIIRDNLFDLLSPYYLLLEGSVRTNKVSPSNWSSIQQIVNSTDNERYINGFCNVLDGQIDQLSDSVYSFLYQNFNIPKLYIPTLRGMRALVHNTDCYSQRTAKDYSIEPDNIFTGLSIYKELEDYLLGGFDKRKLVKAFEIFLSKSFFNNQIVELIPIRSNDVVHIRVGEKEHPIYDLGDGVQALILLTFPLFLRRDKACAIFIEEPETHLHPRWQRFFLETILEYFPKHQFFFTTHSNVLMNWHSSNIYYVKQDSDSDKTLVQRIDTQHSEILEDLGYQASDLLNANYIVWVEGVSDKIYLKQFIKACDPSLTEGLHYTIMMYGGCAQLNHFAIEKADSYKIRIDTISRNFGFCIDSDNSKGKGFSLNKEKTKFQQACKEASKFCWVTKARESENLIPLEHWKTAAIAYAKAIPNHAQETIILDDVTYSEDAIYGDRMKTNVTVSTGKPIAINDKIKMAQQVIKYFPKEEADLKLTPELFEKVSELVSEIKDRNLL